MPIRQATWRDLPLAAQVAASAFWDEDLLGPFMHPHRKTYPSDMALWFMRQLRKDFFNPCCTILLSHPASSPVTITGVAVWGRKGPQGTQELRAQQSWLSWFCGKFFVPLLNWVDERVRPNRAADPARADVLERSFTFIAHHWLSPPHRIENWYLQLLAASPAHQGKGYGKELVTWGVQRAERENLTVSLISAAGKEGFYRRCGFGEPVGWASEGGEENPIHKVPGGAIMWVEPSATGVDEKDEGRVLEVSEVPEHK
ncbi:hypothetical protein AAFC00_005289 [Neodothiora populina]|uniref:N-acetyltransferase domain-containing protein n=1 Tax=Neodothiora populina TaxID=2781224 RepID=A0ABR3PLH2_9PEZI